MTHATAYKQQPSRQATSRSTMTATPRALTLREASAQATAQTTAKTTPSLHRRRRAAIADTRRCSCQPASCRWKTVSSPASPSTPSLSGTLVHTLSQTSTHSLRSVFRRQGIMTFSSRSPQMLFSAPTTALQHTSTYAAPTGPGRRARNSRNSHNSRRRRNSLHCNNLRLRALVDSRQFAISPYVTLGNP